MGRKDAPIAVSSLSGTCYRQTAKLWEMIENDAECAALIRSGRIAEVKRRLDDLLPIEGEGTWPQARPSRRQLVRLV